MCVCVCGGGGVCASVRVSSRVPLVPEVPLQSAGGGPTVVGTEFTNVSNDDIEEVWRDHVATLLKGKSEAAAVNTMFLLNRLFLVSVCLMQCCSCHAPVDCDRLRHTLQYVYC